MSVTLFGSDGPLLPEKLTGEDCKSFRTTEMSGTSVRVVTRFNFPLSGRSMKLSFSRSTQSLNIYPKTEILCLYPNNMHQNKCAPNCFFKFEEILYMDNIFCILVGDMESACVS